MFNYPTPGSQEQVSLDNPLYRLTFVEAVERFFKKTFIFTGRASKREFWFGTLFVYLVALFLELIPRLFLSRTAYFQGTQEFSLVTVFDGFYSLWLIAMIVPSAALLSRRLHDANLSSWFMLIMLIPIVGIFFYIVAGLLPSNPKGVRFDILQQNGTWVRGPNGNPMELGGQATALQAREFIPMYPGNFSPDGIQDLEYPREIEPTLGYQQYATPPEAFSPPPVIEQDSEN